jgi:hypothetical protein
MVNGAGATSELLSPRCKKGRSERTWSIKRLYGSEKKTQTTQEALQTEREEQQCLVASGRTTLHSSRRGVLQITAVTGFGDV